MKSEALAYGVAGICFGLIAGWIIGSQQAQGLPGAARVAARADPSSAGPAERPPRQAPVLDEAKVRTLKEAVERNPRDMAGLVALANAYFDAERYDEAITWYEGALALGPRDVNVSTDLGVSYYYTNQPDRALQQFDHSLSVDPKHTKTILNQGIVRAFGKQDLAGAAEAWQRVVDLAPDSAEAQAARRALESMKAAHPAVGGGQPAAPPGSNN